MLGKKMTIPKAFHVAKQELRDNGLDPYNWAGFVLVKCSFQNCYKQQLFHCTNLE